MNLLTLLRAFVAVAQESSFTAAAAASRTPQPVLSRRVATLERELGGALLVRGPRGADLTSLGRSVLPHATDLIVRADHLLEVARGHVLDNVRAAVPPQADPRLLAAVRHQLERRGVSLSVVEVNQGEREKSLLAGVTQLAVLPVASDRAEIIVVLGGGMTPGRLRGRSLYLEQLRDSDAVSMPAPRLLIQDEDDVPHIRDRLTQTAQAAGLAAYQVVAGLPTSEALMAVHARGDVVVCSRAEATRHQLQWHPLAPALVRGYRLKSAKDHPSSAILTAERGRLLALLARALGADQEDDPEWVEARHE